MKPRTRVILILYILSITISVFIFTRILSGAVLTAEYNSFSDAVVSGNYIYYAQNMGGKGLIFSMTDDGRVYDMFSSLSADEARVEAISSTDESVYAVLSTIRSVENNDPQAGPDEVLRTYFRVVCLNRSLKLQTMTEEFCFDENLLLSGFSAESGGLFLTFIAEDGSAVRVYSIHPNELKIPDVLTGGGVNLESIRSRASSTGRFFVQAKYHDGALEVRTDADEPTGAFAQNDRVAYAVGNMKMSISLLLKLYYTYFIWYAAAVIAWCVILFLLIRLFTDRNRMFYYVMITEAVLLVITATATFTVANRIAEAKAEEHARFAILSLIGLADSVDINNNIDFREKDFYDSARYKLIKNELTEFVSREGNKDIFYDTLIVRLLDSQVVASASGRNLQDIAQVYGQAVDDIETAIYRGETFSAEDLYIDSQNYMAIAVPDADTVPDYMLIGIINNTTDIKTQWKSNAATYLIFLLAFAVGSLLVLLAWYLQNRDLKLVEDALRDTAYGRELRERPLILGGDFKDMWDSLAEIDKRVDTLQYTKLRILEAYYRFAPKNIEKLLQKDSIIEVLNGDHVTLYGTVVTVNANPHKGAGLERYDRIIGRIGHYQKEHDCILIAKSPDLNKIQLFLQDYEKHAVDFVTDLFNTHNQADDMITLSASVFCDSCRFGVTGTDEETTTYLIGEQRRMIESVNAIIAELKLTIVISEEVKNREQISGPLRFIGYTGCGTESGGLKLYEVLDAYPARARAVKIATLQSFNEALEAFYEKNFYISRTLFSDILKEMPDDALVKWYVFESDRYLNESVDDDTFMNLHI